MNLPNLEETVTNGLENVIRNFVKNFTSSKIFQGLKETLNFFKTSDFHNYRLFNCIKRKLITRTHSTLTEIIFNEIGNIFYKDVLPNKRHIALKEAEDFIKIFGSAPESKYETLFNHILTQLKTIYTCTLENVILKYLLLCFIKDYGKVHNNLLCLLDEAVYILYFYQFKKFNLELLVGRGGRKILY
jgi:hypothetical protein